MRATVVITTKNRRADLLKAVASAVTQTAQPDVLVIDDGSTDGTSEAVRRTFPTVRLRRSEQSLGLIVQRNRAAELTRAPFLFSIDDDAVFSTPTIVEATLQEFEHPRVGAVAMPFVEVNRGPAVLQRAPDARRVYAAYTFIGTAHALRRDVFLSLKGYREILFHQGEEEDYCIRMLNAGWITRCGNANPIHHFESPQRSLKRMDFYGARNKVLFAWHNVPWRFLPLHLTATTLTTLLYARHPARFWTRLRGVIAAYGLVASRGSRRQAVQAVAHTLSRQLKQRGATPLEEIEPRLPPAGLGAFYPTNSICEHPFADSQAPLRTS